MIAPQKREQIISWITESGLRPEAKERALTLLRRPGLMEEDAQTILDILQQDLEQDFAEISGLNDEIKNDAEYQALVSKKEEEIALIEKEVEQELSSVRLEVSSEKDAEETERIGDVKSRLGME